MKLEVKRAISKGIGMLQPDLENMIRAYNMLQGYLNAVESISEENRSALSVTSLLLYREIHIYNEAINYIEKGGCHE